MKKILYSCLIASFALSSCHSQKSEKKNEVVSDFKLNYNFSKPDQKYILPDVLEEISGLSYYKGNQLVCLNDEEGKVFFFDYTTGKIVKEIKFGKKGDYEGIEAVGEKIYVMKSNGELYGFLPEEPRESIISVDFDGQNEFEGLSYDPRHKYFLMAVKQREKELDDVKVVYAVSASQKKAWKVIGIPLEALFDKNVKKKERVFKPSGISVHPLSGDIYILASVGKKLLIIGDDGKKKAFISLDPSQYIQPEGICFSPNGDLFISSEGKGGAGYILKFSYKK
ncbi:Uncharacterized protein YjiK [Pseudarcicella hirudinis]|uniref:Uncharacterized protein YjiK n=1 Tax=Pseudarcicella hirudinis TaxID=1079859 RepID=A0A1I5YJB1_9BACT|nr:SdiA-regulated domain-containing protein [Pseudarcicella hirudinis]SFQ44299.1 Uncharacterized protein YjiK [Pseudarcicella hirudinis]